MRSFFGGLGKFIWRFMIIFSFIVNIILVGVLAFLLINIFTITNDVANPLISGLHSSFVALSEADIDWTIPVRDTIDVNFTVPLNTDTVVVLTEPVPLTASAQITLNNSTVTTPVSLTLPVGLRLPVHLNLDVPIDETLPVSLDVRAVIPLEQTQLADVAGNLRLLFEPLSRALNNLPQNWGEASAMVSDWANGNPPNLITDPNDYTEQPWPGFSRTAGENYAFSYENQRLNQVNVGPVQDTGMVLEGGIQWLDAQLPDRAYLYADGCDPEAFNENAPECGTARNMQSEMESAAPQSETELTTPVIPESSNTPSFPTSTPIPPHPGTGNQTGTGRNVQNAPPPGG
ncbi:MAG: hypothetical protein K8L99_25070 [Anaerolineae bacterium]|nr:hypothetical protein [Anaerolineae bacterium]